MDDRQRRRQSVQAILPTPTSSWSGATRGRPTRSAGTSASCAGSTPIGVTATNDVDALLALKPDCVVYNPMWFDVDEMVRILEAGVNIVIDRGVHHRPLARRRVATASSTRASAAARRCSAPASTPASSTSSPSLAAGVCDRIDKITITESADTTGYDSPATEIPVGFGRPIDDPELQEMTRRGTAVFEDAVHLVGDALGVEFDEIVCEAEYAQTTEDLDLGSWKIDAGCVAGVAASWHGQVGGRTIVELRVRWRKGQTLDPDWEIARGYLIQIDGRPTITHQASTSSRRPTSRPRRSPTSWCSA